MHLDNEGLVLIRKGVGRFVDENYHKTSFD